LADEVLSRIYPIAIESVTDNMSIEIVLVVTRI
jgi:hypothetical protein